MGKDVAEKKSTDVVVGGYDDYAGQGFEHQSRDDLAIPFLGVLQGLSPQIETIDGAKPGMLFNTVTEEVESGKDGVLFVPAVTQHCFVEWVPRDAGGGFVAIHEVNSDVVKEAKAGADEYGKYKVGDNDLIETFYIYGVLVDETDALGMAVVAFTSTKIKVYKKFNTKVRTFRVKLDDGRMIPPPLFAHLTRITTVKESNNKGDFYNFSLVPANGSLQESLLATDDPRFQAAAECKRLVESGVARAAFESAGDGSETGDDDIPF